MLLEKLAVLVVKADGPFVFCRRVDVKSQFLLLATTLGAATAATATTIGSATAATAFVGSCWSLSARHTQACFKRRAGRPASHRTRRLRARLPPHMTGSRFVFGVFGACILLIVWNLALFQFFSAELAAVRRRVTMVEDAMQGFDGLLHASAPHNAAVRLPGSLDAQPPRRSDTDNHNDSNHDAESSVRTNSHQAHSELRNNAAPVAPHAAAGPTIPVLVLCYNRAKYLNRTLSTLFA